MTIADSPRHAKPALRILLCSSRGLCAGVVRAIGTVERALATYGSPVYVRHEIVHNRFVVDKLTSQGAVFVDELDQVPDDGSPVIFSAHGVPKSVTEEARRRGLMTIDATCPLVTKVHREAEVHFRRGRHVVLIGHAGHPEILGTMGQLPAGAMTLIETLADARQFVPPNTSRLAYVTQTTLSIDDADEIVACLKSRFREIVGPRLRDICYATTNRQRAVKLVASQVDAMIVVGSSNSSNSRRLTEVASQAGCRHVALVPRAENLDWTQYSGLTSLGLTAGASAPEVLVEEVLGAFNRYYDIETVDVGAADEDVLFPLPASLRIAGAFRNEDRSRATF